LELEKREGGTYCHIALTADICLCERFVKFAGNAKVAKLDLALSIKENIGWFYI
jgi:hypothetical protein